MIKKLFTTSLLGLSFSLPVSAGTMGNVTPMPTSSFYLGAYGGYGTIDGGYKQDGNVTQGRLSLGWHTPLYNSLLFGAEVGVQSGNTWRLDASPELIEVAGGLPIQATLKPFVDVLLTAKYQLPSNPLSIIAKGGIAYRQLQFLDRSSDQDTLNQVNGEFQGGLGYNLTQHVMLTAFYQGIYRSNNAGAYLNSVGDVTIANIPTQQAGFLGVEYSFL